MYKKCKIFILNLGLVLIFIFVSDVLAQDASGLTILNKSTNDLGGEEYSLPLKILILLTGLTLLPSLVLGATAFTRIIIVLSILRQALGTQQTPPNQVLVAIALFLTLYIMSPTLNTIYTTALSPYMDQKISAEEAIQLGTAHLKEFMIKNTGKKELILFKDMRGDSEYNSNNDVPYEVILPAFITSELKVAFQIGFLLFLPFLIIDMVIASILMSLGMMMLSPMLIALPFKLLLFVLVDGWSMTVSSIASTYLN